MGSSQRRTVRCVVALDFGTTYSGYAYSFVQDFERDKLKIFLNQAWNAGITQLISMKTSTALLLTKSGEFKSFGYDAEREYADILLDQNECNYLYFYRFKMELYEGQIDSTMKLKDVRGIEHSALDVFSKSIKALRDHFIDAIIRQGHDHDEDEIKWAITVPAIWSDEAKMFMRKAGETAGIPKDRLIIALEPEVAAIYCQLLQIDKTQESLKTHSKYLIVDLGGGTVDISGYEISKDGYFKQICKATGENCGGTSVDQEFFNVISDILGSENMNLFKEKHTSKYLELSADFECVKRTIRKDQAENEKVNIRVAGIFDNLIPGENFESLVKQSSFYPEKLTFADNKLRLNRDCAKNLFTKTIQNINQAINNALQEAGGRDISVILLVGGLSESNIVQEGIKSAFPDKNFIIPENPVLAVLKGAVVYGHRPDIVTTRITQFNYGRKIKPLFRPGFHDDLRKVHFEKEKQVRCEDAFELLMQKDVEVPVGKKISMKYHTISESQNKIRVCMYKSPNDETKYIDDDGCSKVGECFIPVAGPSKRRREITVHFEFGDTEIIITASGKDLREDTTEKFLLE